MKNNPTTVQETLAMVDNEAVKNNEDKFQEDFYFELTDDEFAVLRSKISTANFSKPESILKFSQSKAFIC